MLSKAALITGAGSGIGAATAIELGRQGFFVYLLGRNRENLLKTAALIPNSAVVVCDLNDPDQIRDSVQKLLATEQGRELEVLVNNAGIFKTHADSLATDEIWMSHFMANLMGPVRLTRELWSHFANRGRGSVVNVSSTLGWKPTVQTSAYSAMKAALMNWTMALAQEGGPKGIRANCVNPGFVDTPIHAFHSLEPTAKADTLKKMGPMQPMGRIGTPEEIAKAIAFLAGDDSRWTTGASLNVDGGIQLS